MVRRLNLQLILPVSGRIDITCHVGNAPEIVRRNAEFKTRAVDANSLVPILDVRRLQVVGEPKKFQCGKARVLLCLDDTATFAASFGAERLENHRGDGQRTPCAAIRIPGDNFLMAVA